MPSVSWYIKRACAMSVDELMHRTRMEVRKNLWRRQVNAGQHASVTVHWDRMPADPFRLNLPADLPGTSDLIMEADAYMRHEWHYGGSTLVEEEINWHRDPASGKVAPFKFGFDINHRDETLVGNIKITWEKSRHHHLSVLAEAFALTGKESYAKEVVDQLLDWIAKNPYLVGVHWTHPLEQGIRLITWVWIERILRNSSHYERLFNQQSPIWQSIYYHQLFIEHTYSRGSSANNHLIGEMAGLFIAAARWPVFEHSQRWLQLAQETLEKEIVKQTFPSGINREMAFSYHIFSLEFFLLALYEAEKSNIQFSSSYQDYTRRMLEVIPHLTDKGGNMPRYGDGDEGMALQLQPYEARRDSWLYHVGHALLQADVPTQSSGLLAAHLLGINLFDNKDWEAPSGSIAFVDAGLYVLTSNRNAEREIFVLADAGPHGYLSITAHAHADALSFALSIDGQPMIVDIGTFAYHTDEYWRCYFRSTPAHNTLTINGQDQSTQQGSFLWSNQAITTVHSWQTTPDGASLEARHDGYKDQGIIHQRTFQLVDNHLRLSDEIKGAGQHSLQLAFHTAPESTVSQTDQPNILHIQRENIILQLTLPTQTKIELIEGQQNGGWYSPRFGVKQPSTTVYASLDATLPITLTTEMEVTYEKG